MKEIYRGIRAEYMTEYNSWNHMKQRCYNPKHVKYPDYGGRCVTVCEKWRESFRSFLDDMGLKPSPTHTIDRINNMGNYEPGNCKWSTPKEQSNNRRKRRQRIANTDH